MRTLHGVAARRASKLNSRQFGIHTAVRQVVDNLEARLLLAAPANDAFAHAIVIQGASGQISGSNAGASQESTEGPVSVWWRWTPVTSGAAEITTIGSGFDTVLSVYTGSTLQTLIRVAYDDDGGGVNATSALSVDVSAGQTYSICVAGYSASDWGSIVLNWQMQTPPVNDNFANATNIGDESLVNGTTNHWQVSESNVGATVEVGELNVIGAGHTIWWNWTPTITAMTQLDSSQDAWVYQDGPDGTLQTLQQVAYANGNFTANAGTTYHIQGDTPSGTGNISLDLAQFIPPGNDNIANAVTFVAGTPIVGTTENATAEAGEAGIGSEAAEHSVWYEWTADRDANAVVTLDDPYLTGRIGIYTKDASGQLVQVASNYNPGTYEYGANGSYQWNYTGSPNFQAVTGTTYYIAVDGAGNTTGTFTLTLDEAAANDNFANAAAIGDSDLVWGTTNHWQVAGGNTAATSEVDEPDANYYFLANHSLWWQWTASDATTAQVSCTGVAYVYQAGADGTLKTLQPIAPAGQYFLTQAGVTYYIQADTQSGTPGDITVDVITYAPPANDNFVNAQSLQTAQATSGTTIGATAETAEQGIGAEAVEHSVWYQWTADSDGEANVVLASSDFVGRLAVYTQDGAGNLVQVATDYQPSGYSYSEYAGVPTFQAAAGTTYYIAVDGISGAMGDFSIAVGYTPANDDLAAATNIGDESLVPGSISHWQVSDDNTFATLEKYDGDSYGHSLWWQWTAQQSSTACVSGDVVCVYSGDPAGTYPALQYVADSGVHFAVQAGTTYFIEADANNGGGTINVDVVAGLPQDVQSFQLDSASPTQVSLSWTPQSDATSFTIERVPQAYDSYYGEWYWDYNNVVTFSVAGDQSSFTDTTLSEGTYQYRITAHSDAGDSDPGQYLEVYAVNPAPNDNLANATIIGPESMTSSNYWQVSGDNRTATLESGEYDYYGCGHTLWWLWTAPASGQTTVRSSAGGNYVQVFDYRAGDSVHSLVGISNGYGSFYAQAGLTYAIQADSSTPNSSIVISVQLQGAPADDDLANAQVIDAGEHISGTTNLATVEPGEQAIGDQAPEHSVWYEWTADQAASVHIDLSDPHFDGRVAVYTKDGSGNLVQRGTNFDKGYYQYNSTGYDYDYKRGMDFQASAGTTYYIAVDCAYSRTGDFTLTLTTSAPTGGPTDIALSATDVAEDQPAGTTVGVLTATDATAVDGFTYTLVAGEGSGDNHAFVIDGDVLKTAQLFDYETKSIYNVRVRVTDADGLSTEKAFEVNVTDLVEVPSPWTINGTAANDVITLDKDGAQYVLYINGDETRKVVDLVSSIAISGLAGSDAIVLSSTVTRGAWISGGGGNDTIVGGSGTDTLIGNAGSDVIDGRVGNDSLVGGGGNDAIYGGAGNDTIVGGGGMDVIHGMAGADLIAAGGGADSLYGGSGNDTIEAGPGTDYIDAGSGADWIDVADGSSVPDTVYVGSGLNRVRRDPSDVIIGSFFEVSEILVSWSSRPFKAGVFDTPTRC